MMKTIQPTLLAAILLNLLTMTAWPAEAEKSRDWNRVVAVPAGARVEVIHGRLLRSQGELIHVTDSEIALRGDSGSTTIARADVRRVTVTSRSRKHRALLGMVIGAGVGALTMVAAAHSGDIDIRRDLLAGAGAVIGAGAGAVVGSATAGPVTVYRSGP